MSQEMKRAETGELGKVYCTEILEGVIREFEF